MDQRTVQRPPWVALFLCIAAGFAGCAPEEAAPELVDPGTPMPAVVEVLMEGPVGFAAALPDLSVITELDGVWHRLPADGSDPELLAEDMGPLRGAAWVPPGGLLLAGEAGLFAFREGQLLPSPIDGLLAGDPPRTLLTVSGNAGTDLWLGGSGLRLWRNGALFSVDVGELPTADPIFVHGPTIAEAPALWVASGSQVYAIVESTNGFAAWPERDDLTVSSMAVDAVGGLWVTAAGGLHHRDASGVWTELVLSHPVRRVLPATEGLWLETESGLWIRPGSRFRPVGAGADLTLFAADDLGRVLARRGEQLVRVSDGRPTALFGLAQDDWVSNRTEVTVMPTLPRRVTGVRVTLNGAEQPVDPESWSFVLDPLDLPEGDYELGWEVSYTDTEEPVTGGLFFFMGAFEPPTWTADLLPLFEDKCTPCHDDGGEAHPLFTPQQWQQDIDDIIAAVNEARMPLTPNPPLSADEVRMIRAWKAGGFLE